MTTEHQTIPEPTSGPVAPPTFVDGPAAPDSAPEPAAVATEAPKPTSARRIAGLRERLREEASRFPAVVVATVAAFVLELLLVLDVLRGNGSVSIMGMLMPTIENAMDSFAPDLSELVSYLSGGCWLGLYVAVAAQLACERRGYPAADARKVQVTAAIAGLVVSLLLCGVGALLQREAVCEFIRIGIMLASVSLSMWLLMTPDNEPRLVPKVVCQLLYALFVCLVICVGLLICLLAAYSLLFGTVGNWPEVVLIGCETLLWPNLVCALLPRYDDELRVSRAYRALVGYGVLPLCLLLLLVLYGYIVKIALAWNMPSGEMNWFGSFALLVYVGLWMGLRDVPGKSAAWFVRWGWLLLVPVVSVQLVGVAIRLRAYGLTVARYASLLCTGVGIAALALAARNASPRHLFAVMAAVALVATATPANVIDVPNLSQTARLRDALADAGLLEDGLLVGDPSGVQLTQEQRERIKSSWDYLSYADHGMLGSRLVDDLRERSEYQSFDELFGYPREEGVPAVPEEDRYFRGFFVSDAQATDVQGFSRVYRLDMTTESGGRWAYADDGFRVNAQWEDGTSVDTKVEDLVDEMMARIPKGSNHGSSDKIVVAADDLRVELDDGRVLALSSVAIQTRGGKAQSAELEGLLLIP